jgi:nitronate monooxygenase
MPRRPVTNDQTRSFRTVETEVTAPVEPLIIQGGMGVAISDWRLANAVASYGQLGVVSGTGIDTVMVRRLQLGDPDGLLRLAFEAFPVPEIAERVWARYLIEGGKDPDAAFRAKPSPRKGAPQSLDDLLVLANFVEVFLAKRGHGGRVGINLLTKIQFTAMPSLYGAMLAGVDYVLMGAGIPRQIPGILDKLAAGEVASQSLDVADAQKDERWEVEFDPSIYGGRKLKRPKFLAIVSSSALARTLVRRSGVDGLVVESPSAGGHNAPPRGEMRLDDIGQPIYGERDEVDLSEIRELGVPFWLAGGQFGPDCLRAAEEAGAAGVQVGTAFALCKESGMSSKLKQDVVEKVRSGTATVHTDPLASPTSFPFKTLRVEGTLSDSRVYVTRKRICDLGYLREAYRKSDGTLGYRCAGEPLDDFVRKGGDVEDTVGRKCICNALLSTAGFGQVRKDGRLEPAIVTTGDDIGSLLPLLGPEVSSYAASDVIDFLLGRVQN